MTAMYFPAGMGSNALLGSTSLALKLMIAMVRFPFLARAECGREFRFDGVLRGRRADDSGFGRRAVQVFEVHELRHEVIVNDPALRPLRDQPAAEVAEVVVLRDGDVIGHGGSPL